MTEEITEPENYDPLAILPQSGKLMGLDLGSKTIGVAISDGLRLSATPLLTIRRKKFADDAIQLLQIIKEHSISGIVLGLPLNMDGSEGPRAQSTRAFARNLERFQDKWPRLSGSKTRPTKKQEPGFDSIKTGSALAAKTSAPIAFWDERLSTSAVTRTLIEADVSRARRAQLVDKLAASFILQGALDRLG